MAREQGLENIHAIGIDEVCVRVGRVSWTLSLGYGDWNLIGPKRAPDERQMSLPLMYKRA